MLHPRREQQHAVLEILVRGNVVAANVAQCVVVLKAELPGNIDVGPAARGTGHFLFPGVGNLQPDHEAKKLWL